MCHQQVARRKDIQLRVSVNLSDRSLQDPQLPKMIADALYATGAEPDQLMLEVTESAIVLGDKKEAVIVRTIIDFGHNS